MTMDGKIKSHILQARRIGRSADDAAARASAYVDAQNGPEAWRELEAAQQLLDDARIELGFAKDRINRSMGTP